MNRKRQINKFLVIGGAISIAVALLHIIIIVGGANWYRFFGAGETMAKLAENGESYPIIITFIIAFILAIWGIYAFSGAGLIRNKMPFLKLGLIIISSVYILRGLLGIPMIVLVDQPYLNELKMKMTFMIISSLFSLSLGVVHAVGLIQIWSNTRK